MLILVRHGECNPDYPADPGLTPAGAEMVRDLAQKLYPINVGLILHSPKRRTAETAAVFSVVFPQADKRRCEELREVDPAILAGDGFGPDKDHARAARDIDRWVAPFLDGPPVLLISHRNFLWYCLKRVTKRKQDDPFARFAATWEVGRPTLGGPLAVRRLPLC